MIFFPTKSNAIWHVQRFQSTNHSDLKHKLQLFPSPFELLFSHFKASVKQYCLRPLRRRHRHYTETHTRLSALSASIWIILIYNSALCTSTQHCVGKLLLLTPFFDDGLAKSVEITSTPRNHATAVACISPCTLAQSSFQQNKNVNLVLATLHNVRKPGHVGTPSEAFSVFRYHFCNMLHHFPLKKHGKQDHHRSTPTVTQRTTVPAARGIVGM